MYNNMNLQENISRIKSMMGLLTEVTNPYKVEWLEPTSEYFKQELSELLGNPIRFTDEEFFNPENYDTIYSVMPHTFKTIAEFSKGGEVESNNEVKNILLNQNMESLLKKEERWNELKNILMNDPQSIKEGYDFFRKVLTQTQVNM